MDNSKSFWIILFLISGMTRDIEVFARAVGLHTLPLQSSEVTLRADRWRCAELKSPWLESTSHEMEDDAALLKLHMGPLSAGTSRGLVFPGKSLFSLIRQVYRCCQEIGGCMRVKGIQGRIRGDADLDFVLTREMLLLTVLGAELHLHFTNPQHLDIQPWIPFMSKQNLPTRYTSRFLGDMMEVRVDLLLLFQSLSEVVGDGGPGPSLVNMREPLRLSSEKPPGEKVSSEARQDTRGDAWGEALSNTIPTLDLGLILRCSRAGSGVPCRTAGVHLAHPPFMALYYK